MPDRTIAVRLWANVAEFKAQLAAAGMAVRDMGATIEASSAQAQRGSKIAAGAMLAIGAAATAAAALSAKAAIDLQTQMQNVATIWNEGAMSIKTAGDAVVEMSTRLPQSASTLAQGLYDIASSGFEGADALNILEASATAASAGMTDTATAARVIDGAIKAYGLTAGDASRVSDALFATVKYGIVTFEQLANVMGDFMGTASALNITIEETGAAFSAITLAGIPAAEAGTSLNRVMTTLIKPGEELQAVFADLGVTSGEELVTKFGGLHGAITAITQDLGGNRVALATVFPEMRALRGILALTANDGQTYNQMAAEMGDSNKTVGMTLDALRKQQEGVGFQFGILKNNIAAVGITIGQALLPVLSAVVGWVQTAVDIFSALPAPLQVIIAAVGILGGLMVGLAGAFVLLSPAILAASTAFEMLTGALATAGTAMTGFVAAIPGIGWALAAVSAIAVVAVGIWGAHQKAQADNKRAVDQLKDSLDAESGALTSNTDAIVRNSIVKDDLDKKAMALGVSLGDLVAAMKGDEDANKRVQAAIAAHNGELDAQAAAADAAGGAVGTYADGVSDAAFAAAQGRSDGEALTKAIGKQSGQVKAAQGAWERDKTLKDADTAANNANAASSENAAQAIADHAKALGNIAKAMSQQGDAGAAFTAAGQAAQNFASGADNALKTTHDAEKRRLDDTGEAEKRSLDDRWTATMRDYDRRKAAAETALADQKTLARDAIDARYQAAKDAFALEERAQKESLDRQQRAEKEALDQQLTDLKRSYDDRQAVLDDDFNRQKDVLEETIKYSWGAARDAAIAQRDALVASHKAQTRALEDEQTNQANGLKDGLSDQQQVQDDKLADMLKARKDSLDTEHDDAVKAWGKFYDDQKAALDNQYTLEKQHLDDTKTLEEQHLADRLTTLQRSLDDRQKAEDNAAETRRTNMKQQHDVTLGEYKAKLDEFNKANETKLADLKTIWEKSGRTLTDTTLAQLADLPPGMVHQLATAGDQSFTSFMSSFQTAAGGVDATRMATIFAPFSDEIKGLLQRVGEFGGANMMASVANGLANDATGAQRLRDILAGLMAPKEISPGVYAVPKAGGGYYPLRMSVNADGGVYRFADGGEYHQAQIAPGTTRIWAEPETGGEAYIPLSPLKRGRSTSILAQTASIFGYDLVRMANGGIFGGGQGGGATTITVPVHVDARIAAGVDMNYASDLIAQKVQRGVQEALSQLRREVQVRAWRNG